VNEFLRVVCDAAPEWWLMENVAGSPAVTAPGYVTQSFTLDASHLDSEQHRLRKLTFGHRPGSRELVIPRPSLSQPRLSPGQSQPTCLASEGRRLKGRRSWAEFCRLQGLPAGFDLEPFTVAAKYTAIGNVVPYAMGATLAMAIVARDHGVTPHRVCACGCGSFVTGRKITAFQACRKRMERERKKNRQGTPPAVSQLNMVIQAELGCPV